MAFEKLRTIVIAAIPKIPQKVPQDCRNHPNSPKTRFEDAMLIPSENEISRAGPLLAICRSQSIHYGSPDNPKPMATLWLTQRRVFACTPSSGKHHCQAVPQRGIVRKSRCFMTFCYYALSLEYPQALCSSISSDCIQRRHGRDFLEHAH
jgi:hypothetical protein